MYSKRQYSTLTCKKCGLKMTIPRRQSRKRKQGHIKTMYCARCKSESDFVEDNFKTLAERGANDY